MMNQQRNIPIINVFLKMDKVKILMGKHKDSVGHIVGWTPNPCKYEVEFGLMDQTRGSYYPNELLLIERKTERMSD